MKYSNKLYENYKSNYESQFGEDGVLEEIFKRLKIVKGTAVDIGAADGIWHSNTFNFILSGWEVFEIEGNTEPHFFGDKLIENAQEYPTIHPRIAMVTPENVNDILDDMEVPEEVDLLNIDIDGMDFWVWKALKREPKVVVIEIEPRYYPTDMKYHNPEGDRETNPPQNLTGFGPMFKLGTSKGYTLIAMTISNLIFLRNDLIANLKMPQVTENPLGNFNPEYLTNEDKKRWMEYEKENINN